MNVPVLLLPRWVRWAAVLAVAAAIFYLSVLTAPPESAVIDPLGTFHWTDLVPLDKWRHFVAYAAFAGSLAYATATWNWRTRRVALFVVGVAVVYGVGIEFVQATVPSRYFSMGDAYANVVGAVLAAPLVAVRDRVTFLRIPGDRATDEESTAD